MDPLSMLGAATGVTSLVINIADDCVKCYKYFSEAARMPREYRYLKIRLQIEQQRFLNFALEAGILHADGTISITLQVNKSLLLALLSEIKTILEDYAAANCKYEQALCQAEATNRDDDEPEIDLMALMDLSIFEADLKPSKPVDGMDIYLNKFCSFGKGIARSGKTLRRIIAEPKRLVWAVFDKEKFEELISKLERLNSFLITLLDASQAKSLQDAMSRSYLGILQIRNDIRSLSGLIEALSREGRGNPMFEVSSNVARANGDPFSVVMAEEMATHGRQEKYLKRLAEIKIKFTRMEKGMSIASTQSTLFDSMQEALDLSHFTFSGDECGHARRAKADYHGRSVWIEWKDQPPNRTRINSVSTVENRIQLLTDLLSGEKPEGFRSPPCVGYVKSTTDFETRYGIVFESPPGLGHSMKPVTLHQLLIDHPHPSPSLSARVSLCATLAQCLHSFHSVNWLHKGLSSHNILFFARDTTIPDLSMPYVSGFEFSRPDCFEEMTEKPVLDASQDLYRHPSAQSALRATNFRKSYDMYSLGIVLIEIATWERIDKVMGFESLDEQGPRDLRDMRPKLLGSQEVSISGRTDTEDPPTSTSSFLDRVSSNFGEKFRAIVELCLRVDEIEHPIYKGESTFSVMTRLQRMMEEAVVKRLRALESAMNF